MPVTKKKVFENTAAILKKHYDACGSNQNSHSMLMQQVITDFGYYFATDNPNFDSRRFWRACGLDESAVEAMGWAFDNAQPRRGGSPRLRP